MIIRHVTNSDIKFLYDLLKERTPIQSISHAKMPTFKEHEQFVKSKPYKKWYVISIDVGTIGSIYLTKNNEIGIFLKKQYCHFSYGNKALKLFMEQNPHSFYLANINPQNENSIKFFDNNNFKPYQVTYRFN